ncbi:MAG: octanoyltransferase, partial [Chitinophagaceae bacterium]|nr:octanoyltransferase [Chitinophagaceae bacterium]
MIKTHGQHLVLMGKQNVIFQDLGQRNYQSAWDYQEQLLKENVGKKSLVYGGEPGVQTSDRIVNGSKTHPSDSQTCHYLLFVEHPPVYTLGKSGKMENLLIGELGMTDKDIEFYKTNRGGDITFHG